jgi:hypothetical protein
MIIKYTYLFFFFALGFLYCVQGEFTNDVSERAAGPIFNDHE